MKLTDNAKAWTIRYTRPKVVTLGDGTEKIWQYNHCSIVASTTVWWALDALLREYPDATVISCHPACIGPIVIDDTCVQ